MTPGILDPSLDPCYSRIVNKASQGDRMYNGGSFQYIPSEGEKLKKIKEGT